MKILSVSGILPIPGLIDGNDFVFSLYASYMEQYPEDLIIIIRPTQYKTNINKVISGKTELNLLKGKRSYRIEDFRIEIYPFLSARRFRDLHAILSYSIYLFNHRKLDALIREQRFDIVHAQYIFPDGLLAYFIHKKYHIPYVITTHKELYFLKYPISRYISKRILKNAYRILPINYLNFNYFKRMGMNNIELLPLGYSAAFLRHQKPPDTDIVKIITVSRLLPYKNVKSVLYAIARLVEKYPISYTIIGCGPEWKRLHSIVKSNGIEEHVNFIENLPRDQIADEMSKHDIFILTSYIETFGRVYFEAMALGIPIICSEDSGIHGYYKNMEEGVSVVHNNIDDIADKLERLITQKELRVRIGKKGQKLVEAYTWKNIVMKNHHIYQEMAGGE